MAGDPATRPHGPRWPGILGRVQPSRLAVAGLAIGVACAMKLTAWPALPVIALMVAARDGSRAAWRFVAVAGVTAGAAIAATAPAALAKPGVFLQNTILYPLGLTRHLTPAASPLPGHLLAATGTAGHWAAIGLLAAAGLAVAAWLIWRRPANARAAAWRLAVGLCVMFVLSPATRWGYFAYPLGLLGWLALTRRAHPAADGSTAAPAPVASVPGQGEPASAAMAGLLPLCGSGPHDPGDRALGIDLDTA
jgi:phosphatidylinositol alpha-1,6-mannosyltransferase